MAKKTIEGNKIVTIQISRQEATELIAYLTCNLAKCTLPGTMSGKGADLVIMDRGVVIERLLFWLEEEDANKKK